MKISSKILNNIFKKFKSLANTQLCLKAKITHNSETTGVQKIESQWLMSSLPDD